MFVQRQLISSFMYFFSAQEFGQKYSLRRHVVLYFLLSLLHKGAEPMLIQCWEQNFFFHTLRLVEVVGGGSEDVESDSLGLHITDVDVIF